MHSPAQPKIVQHQPENHYLIFSTDKQVDRKEAGVHRSAMLKGIQLGTNDGEKTQKNIGKQSNHKKDLPSSL